MPEFGAQSIEPRQQNLETFRTVSFSGKKSSNRFRAANLPEARDESPQGLGRLQHRIRIAKTRLATDSSQSLVFKGFCQSVGFTQIPGFKFLTNNPHKRISPACLLARLQKSPFRRTQSPPSLSRRMTKRTPGSRHARSLRGMLFSRSLFPSCAKHMKVKSGYRRGSNPFGRFRMDASSTKKTTLFNGAALLRPLRAATAGRAGRKRLASRASRAGHLHELEPGGVRSPMRGGLW